MSDDLWEGTEDVVVTTWQPIDLGPVLSGDQQPVLPLIGDREDGIHLFYPGKTHSVVGESEAGKSWLALLTVYSEALTGHSTVFLDFEDDEHIHVSHLLAMGMDASLILKHFIYYRPDRPITRVDLVNLCETATGANARAIWLDGITEAMVLHNYDPLSNKDIASFNGRVINPLARQGFTPISLDHVVKSGENRGRYSLGGVHKLNAVSGAQYILENREPFGIGRTGRSTVRIAKDRPGQLRKHGLRGKEGLVWFGDLVIQSHAEEFAEVRIEPPSEATGAAFRPTGYMVKLSQYIEEHPGLTQNALQGAITGKTVHLKLALELLQADGYVRVERSGQKHLHYNVKPFREQS